MNQQGSAEWIQERLGRFTASEIHKLIPSGKGGNVFSETGKTYILDKDIEVIKTTLQELAKQKATELTPVRGTAEDILNRI